jgi:uncharacterized membrane protein YwaF
MIEVLKEFFGFGGYQREPEGYFSWQHLTFVTVLVLIMFILALYIGIKNKNKDIETKNKVLIIVALLIDGFELLKIIIFCLIEKSYEPILSNLPLFLCSIQLITIPLAAFSKGRIKEASLDFVFIFGLLGALLGTYLAGNNYAMYPVLSFDNVVSGITHCLSGFASLYIVLSGLCSMKKKNIVVSFAILCVFCIMAYIANITLDTNYMFLMEGDNTPYDIIYNMVNGSKILYPLIVVILFLIYITVFYYIFYIIKNKKNKSIKA